MQTAQGILRTRLLQPQASQLAQCSVACPRLVTDGCCTTTMAFTPSQFFTGTTRMAVTRDSEPCSSAGLYSFGSRGAKVVCMARERRVKMVSQQIRREISSMLLYDKVVQAAILPETALGADMYLTAVTTISEVEMSKDLSVAKVYVSIYGDERGQEKGLEGLRNIAGYVRKGLAKSMNLKHTPEVRFIKDEALERGARVIGVLDKLKRERELKELERKQELTGLSLGDTDEIVKDTADEDVEENFEYDPEGLAKVADEDEESDWDDDENITFIK